MNLGVPGKTGILNLLMGKLRDELLNGELFDILNIIDKIKNEFKILSGKGIHITFFHTKTKYNR